MAVALLTLLLAPLHVWRVFEYTLLGAGVVNASLLAALLVVVCLTIVLLVVVALITATPKLLPYAIGLYVRAVALQRHEHL